MNVLFLNPPGKGFHARSSRWEGSVNRSGISVPPLYLAGACGLLLSKGINARIIDAAVSGLSRDQLNGFLTRDSLLVMEVCTPSIDNDFQIAAALKERYGCALCFVGQHTSALPRETLENYPVDFVCVGEYEFTILELAGALENKSPLNSITGLAFRDGAGICINPRRELADLNALPILPYEQLPVAQYHDPITRRRPYMSLLTSRGCSFKCLFCVGPQVMYGGRVRFRDPRLVVEEMRILSSRFGVREVFFDDDTFTLNKEHVREICRQIHNSGLRLDWSCFTRCDTIDKGQMVQMKQAGCYMLRFGIESLDDELLLRMQKGLTIKRIEDFISLAKSQGLRLHATVMLGFPGETKASIERTLAFLKKSPIDFVQFSLAIPYPGTAFYDQCRKDNILLSGQWSDYDGTSHSVVKLEGVTPEYLSAAIDRAYREFYLRPGYILKRILLLSSFDEAKCSWKSFSYLLKSQLRKKNK